MMYGWILGDRTGSWNARDERDSIVSDQIIPLWIDEVVRDALCLRYSKFIKERKSSGFKHRILNPNMFAR